MSGPLPPDEDEEDKDLFNSEEDGIVPRLSRSPFCIRGFTLSDCLPH